MLIQIHHEKGVTQTAAKKKSTKKSSKKSSGKKKSGCGSKKRK